MAVKATREVRETERTVIDKTPVVVLELDEEAAIALCALVGSVGGYAPKGELSIRDHTDAIWTALSGQGYGGVGAGRYKRCEEYRRTLTTKPRVGEE